jgi:CDP-4-dehydro-6-deoxyglucose reductase, E3
MSNKRNIFETLVSTVLDHTHETRELVLQVKNPGNFQFKAGQFVMLHVPQEGKPALRAYSLASDDRDKNQFRLIFKNVPGGIASTFVWKLRVGETLNFTGPFGGVTFSEPPSRQIVFFNTGSGIAQHLSFLYSKADLFPAVKYKMYFGLYREKDIYLRQELGAFAARFKNFEYHYVLSDPSPNWIGKKGFVQHYLTETDYKNIDTSFYLCGNPAMIQDTKKILIERDGLDAKKIHSEAFH